MKRKVLTIAILASPIGLAAFILGAAAGYGVGGTGYTNAAPTVTGTVTDANGAVYSWASTQKRVFISTSPNSAANLWIRFNQDTADNDSGLWDVCLQPGDSWSGVTGMRITKIAIFADATATYGTDFVVKGVD